jgi:hypothetical protein
MFVTDTTISTPNAVVTMEKMFQDSVLVEVPFGFPTLLRFLNMNLQLPSPRSDLH